MNTLDVTNLCFSYGNQPVLEEVTFSYTCKDFLAIIGPNGGGKSTLLKLLLGLLEPQSGTISLFGNSPKDASSLLAYVPQNTNTNLSFPITAFEVALMGCLKPSTFGFFSKADKEEALHALERVGIAHLKDAKIGELSGGQRQRVFIARALCAKAKLLLLDEPTASVDTQGQQHIFELLQSLNQSLGVIVVSHDINVVLGYATKIAHVNRRLYMHDAPSKKTKETILYTLRNAQGHLCPVELINAHTCTHPDHHHGPSHV